MTLATWSYLSYKDARAICKVVGSFFSANLIWLLIQEDRENRMEDSSTDGDEDADELERSKEAGQKVCLVSFDYLL